MYARGHLRFYVQHRQFILVTKCTALMWLFISQNLSSKMYRWALNIVACGMLLKWRKGMGHIAPVALSSLRRKGPQQLGRHHTGEGITEGQGKGPEGPVLQAIPLQGMTTSKEVDEEAMRDGSPDVALLNSDSDEIQLDGICLADVGPMRWTTNGGRI